MLDDDLAKIYGVTTKRLNEQVKRNIDRSSKELESRKIGFKSKKAQV